MAKRNGGKGKNGSKGNGLEHPVTEAAVLAALPATVREKLLACAPRQRRFVVAYCGEAQGNATAAAEIAGYASGHNAAVQGSWLLTFPEIREAVDAWMVHFAMGAAELTARIADLATVNPGPFVVHQGTKKTVKYEVTVENWHRYAHWVRAIEFDPKTGEVVKLHLHDAQRAQATLAKILKLYSDAPIFNLTLYLQKLTNDEVLQQLAEARKALSNPSAPSPN